MKHPDSETLKALKDKAETDPVGATDDLLARVLAGVGREKKTENLGPEPQET